MALLGATIVNGALKVPGGLFWQDSGLPEQTSPQYFLVLDAFASGGQTKWTSKASLAGQLLKTTFDATDNTYGATMKAINTYITSLLYDGSVE